MIQLSKRLRTIAGRIPPGSRVADIGSDHAYLPVYLVQSGRSPFVVAGEVNEGPFQAACKQVRDSGLDGPVSVRKGDGLAVIEPGEVDVIVIAGMGGQLITRILAEGREKWSGIARLVLQPNVDEAAVRLFGLQNHWLLQDEEIIEEDGRFYEILTFVPGDGELPYQNRRYPRDLLLKMGPFLIERQGEIFRRKWEQEMAKLRKVIAALERSQSPAAQEKRESLVEEYRKIEEVLK